MFHVLGTAECERFAGDDWVVEFAIRAAFERRWSANAAFFVGIERR